MDIKLVVTIATILVLSSVINVYDAAHATRHNSSKIQGITPAEIITLGDKKYYISTQDVGKKRFTDVIRLCKELGMKLLSLETEEEAKLVTKHLADNGYTGNYYTSGTRINVQWLWSAVGRAMVYTNWAIREPDEPIFTENPCMYLDALYGTWYDQPCYYEEYFICEEIKLTCP